MDFLMDSWFTVLFSQYANTPTHLIVIELIAVFCGVLSVIFAKKQNILVFAYGIVSTILYVYMFYLHNLWGNMLINAYYTIMSIYGWVLWAQKNVDSEPALQVTRATKKQWLVAGIIFILAIIFVTLIYSYQSDFEFNLASGLDILTTSICCSAMWFMAKKIIEHWLLWILADTLILPMFFYEKMYFTTLQFVILTFIAYKAYIEWKKYLTKN
ncbi:MAG: nicotinamide riboside transporter PnuC [Neisseriaceae bacterium]|nr:MAG: nicotinamide riboside transporter PnuC [Neisseriaceae bacterium]